MNFSILPEFGIAAWIATGILVLAGIITSARLLRRGTLGERFVALSVLVLILVSFIAVTAARSASGAFLDVVVVACLLDFVSAATIARFIERRGM